MQKKAVQILRKEPLHDCAGHLEPLINIKQLKVTARNVIRAIKFLKLEDKFDAIAFRGMSGSLIAPIVALRLDKTLIGVRKGEECHSCRQVEGDLGADRYMIIDDFVSSGETVNAIRSAILRRVKSYKTQYSESPEYLNKLGKLKYIGVLQANKLTFSKVRGIPKLIVWTAFIGAGTEDQYWSDKLEVTD